MSALAARHGYPNLSVAQVSTAAGVSSATFYELFADKEDCLHATYRAVMERMLARMRPVDPDSVASQADWEQAAKSALARPLGSVERDPDGTRVVLIEALAAGSTVQAERRAMIALFESRVADFLESAWPYLGVIDLPPAALMGALRSLIARHLRAHTEDQLAGLAGELVAWLAAYAAPGRELRWSTSEESLLPVSTKRRLRDSGEGGAPPTRTRLPRGRHGLSASVVARSQRTRIIHATAELTMINGYAGTKVTQVVAAAGVSRDVFYEHFKDKEHAFLEAQQYLTQHILDACSAAYFAAEDWPRRVWDGLRVLLQIIVENPALSHLRLVECYAAGHEAVRRAEDITRAFTVFLEEGYHQRPQAKRLPHLCSQAISGAIFELIQRDVARADLRALQRRLPQLCYVAIAPFIGAEAAIRAVQQLAAAEIAR